MTADMRMVFAGSAAAFATCAGNFHSNVVVETADAGGETRRLLIDCGSDARWSLKELGLGYTDIDAVYVSHLHGDHVGGLEWLGVLRYFHQPRRRPALFVPAPIRRPLWDTCLKGTMTLLDFGPADLESFFEVTEVPEDEGFTWMGIRFDLVPLVHLRGGGYVLWSYGLRIGTARGEVFFTSDCRFERDRLDSGYERAALIFQDCETQAPRTGAHPHFEDLCTLPDGIREKMWLYHVNCPPLPDARAAGFRGIVAPRQDFSFPL